MRSAGVHARPGRRARRSPRAARRGSSSVARRRPNSAHDAALRRDRRGRPGRNRARRASAAAERADDHRSRSIERPGDSWRKRYKSLCLHDPVWYDHLPYLPFPDHWPVFSPKDKIADWLEMYTKVMELNYWGSAECKRARYDEAKQEWTVEVVRDGKPLTLRPRQLVLATGSLGVPNMPSLPGMESVPRATCTTAASTRVPTATAARRPW